MKTNRTKVPSAVEPGARSQSPRARRPLGLCALLCGCACAVGCDQPGPRVYSAMAFDASTQCLEPYAALGLVQAEDLPATCAAVCLMQGDTLYVSEVCPPYPAEATLIAAADSAPCTKALSLIDADGGACAPSP